MKARVFVTLKPGVLDPQGKAIHHALEGLGFGGVNDVRAGKLIELDLADGTSDADIEAMCRKLLANTVIENFRIERLETLHERAVIVFPGSNCDRDLAVAIETGHRPRPGDGLAPRQPSFPTGTDLIAIPGGFSYGDYLRSGAMAARSPVMRAVADAAGTRRAGARHLQRLPGADRGRPAARRADAQRRAALRLPDRSG